MIDLKEQGVQEIVKYFSHEVNNMLFNPERITEEQLESKQMKELDICWIRILSSATYRTDLRNEASAKRGRQLAEIPFVKKKMELVNNQKMEEVAKEMTMEHRTLQQNFSKLTFFHLLQTCNQKEQDTLVRAMGESFCRLPLI